MRAILFLLCLAACTAQPPVANDGAGAAPMPATSATLAPAAATTPAPSTIADADTALLGRWIGVEGMVLNVARGAAPGHYTLAMQWDLDHRGTFDGALAGDPANPVITFERDGKAETLTRTDGAATGLRYLAGKRDCLTVRSGEGYCRP